MKRIYKGLASLIVLVVLFLPAVQRSLPKIPWVILFILTLTYGLSLFLSIQIPAPRRLAIAYLVLTGLSYLIVGTLGFFPSSGLIESPAWDHLVSPYPLLSFIEQWTHHFPYGVRRAPYETAPYSEHPVSSSIVTVAGSIAIVAAVAMSKGRKIAYRTWLVLLVIVLVELAGYIILAFISVWQKELVLPTLLTASYVFAYVMARKGVEFREDVVREKQR